MRCENRWHEKVHVGNDQEKAKLAKDSHLKNQGGKKFKLTISRVSIEGVKKLYIDFSNNKKLRYVKYHIYGQCKKLLKKLTQK